MTPLSGAPDPVIPDQTAFSVALHYDPQMVAELAMGADHPHDICERYNVDSVDYEHLSTLPWFNELVARKRQEFADEGLLFTAKAAMMAEALLTRLFQQSMAGVLAAPLTIDVAKQLTDIGRLKPLPANVSAGPMGPAFQINIQVNGADVVTHAGRTLVAAPPDEQMSLEFPPAGSSPATTRGGQTKKQPDEDNPVSASPVLPPEPDPIAGFPDPAPDLLVSAGIRVPDFDLRPSALTGNPMAVQAAMGATAPMTYPQSLSTVGLPTVPRVR